MNIVLSIENKEIPIRTQYIPRNGDSVWYKNNHYKVTGVMHDFDRNVISIILY